MVLENEIGRINWLDCAKTIAIMAVIIDHCNGLLYTNSQIAQASYYSTSLFVLLTGISASLSFDKDAKTNKIKIFRRLKNLFIQYLVATLIVTCFNNKFFDLKVFLSNLINFSAAGPYYYFVFLFQLIVISPFLIRWCKFCEKQKLSFFWHISTLLAMVILSAIAINYTFILAVHGGGRFLWGGTYCLLYYAGILLEEKDCFKRRSRKFRLIMVVVLFGIWLIWWNGMCRGVLPFDKWLSRWWGEGFNPPSVNFMTFACITLFFCYAFFSLLDELQEADLIKWFINMFTWIGRNTLYIFLYHLLVGNIEFYVFTKFGMSLNGMVSRIFYFIGMLVFPVAAKELFTGIRKRIVLAIYE